MQREVFLRTVTIELVLVHRELASDVASSRSSFLGSYMSCILSNYIIIKCQLPINKKLATALTAAGQILLKKETFHWISKGCHAAVKTIASFAMVYS